MDFIVLPDVIFNLSEGESMEGPEVTPVSVQYFGEEAPDIPRIPSKPGYTLEIVPDELLEWPAYQESSPLMRALLRCWRVPREGVEMSSEGTEFTDAEMILVSSQEGGCESLAWVTVDSVILVRYPTWGFDVYPDTIELDRWFDGEGEGGVLVDSDEKWAVLEERCPALVAQINDIRSVQIEEQARRDLEDGSFVDHMDEDTFFPMVDGLYFPLRPEGKNMIAYDAPEALPYLRILAETGWDGAVWMERPF